MERARDPLAIIRGTEGGAQWSELAQLDPLAAVLDSADVTGAKNRAIDEIHKRALARAVGDLRGRRILDFGCGTGRLSEWLLDRGADVDGVDVTPEMIAVARERVPAARFHLIEGDNLPFPTGDFHLVVTAYVLQYYVHRPGFLVDELMRVLRDDGRVVAIEQVTSGDIGRGGSVEEYARFFRAGGAAVAKTRFIRAGDSRLMSAAVSHPTLFGLPLLHRFVAWEAAARERVETVPGRYADALFLARRMRRDSTAT